MFGHATRESVLTPSERDQARQDGLCEWVAAERSDLGWRVEEPPGRGRAVDIAASMPTRTWLVQVHRGQGGVEEWPSAHRPRALKGAARRQNATPVVAFVDVEASAQSVRFWSARTRRAPEP